MLRIPKRVGFRHLYQSTRQARNRSGLDVLESIRDARPPPQRLSVREHQILLMLPKGMSLTHIADEIMISVKTPLSRPPSPDVSLRAMDYHLSAGSCQAKSKGRGKTPAARVQLSNTVAARSRKSTARAAHSSSFH